MVLSVLLQYTDSDCPFGIFQTLLTIKYRNFKMFDQESFICDLLLQDLGSILQITDQDESLDLWYEKLNSTLVIHAPLATKRVKKILQPKWYKNEFSPLRDQRLYFHKIKDFEN